MAIALFFTVVIAIDVIKQHGVAAESATGFNRLLSNAIGIPILLIMAYSLFFVVVYLIAFECSKWGLLIGIFVGCLEVLFLALIYSMGLTPAQQTTGAYVIGGLSTLFAIGGSVWTVRECVLDFKSR